MFSDGLGEFDDAREVVQSLIEEYKASESPDYIRWGLQQEEHAASQAALERMPGEPGLPGVR